MVVHAVRSQQRPQAVFSPCARAAAQFALSFVRIPLAANQLLPPILLLMTATHPVFLDGQQAVKQFLLVSAAQSRRAINRRDQPKMSMMRSASSPLSGTALMDWPGLSDVSSESLLSSMSSFALGLQRLALRSGRHVVDPSLQSVAWVSSLSATIVSPSSHLTDVRYLQ